MAFPINQQTFDDVVRENINDFEMSPEDAVKEAVKQFKSQGVDLSQISTDYVPTASFEIVNESIAKLKHLNDEGAAPDAFIEQLKVLKKECDKGIQFRLAAGKIEAYDVLLNTLLKHENNIEVKRHCVKALHALLIKQPDLHNEQGSQIILAHLDETVDPEIQKFTLKWTKESCIKHEMNRQALVDLKILDKLAVLLHKAESDVLREILAVFRVLTLDDDIRVEFGRGPEHARLIAGETLHSLIGLLEKFKTDVALINDLMLTLSNLLVTAEFCKQTEEIGGLELIHDAMNNFQEHEKINRQCFKLIKALAYNDECKAVVVQKGLAPTIVNALNIHKTSPTTASAGLSCVATLVLRCPNNSKILFETGVPDVIVEIMKIHRTDKAVQKSASWAIRNMVSRSRYQNEHFLELGVEDILKESLEKFKEHEFDIKLALRDLGCEIELKEEWTGKGGMINTDQK